MIKLSNEMTAIIVTSAVEKMAEVNKTSHAIVLEAIVAKVPNAIAQFEKLLKAGHKVIDDIATKGIDFPSQKEAF